MLKRNLPALKTDTDQHYADILTALYKKRLREMHEEASQRQGAGHQLGAEEKPETQEKPGADRESEIESTEDQANVGSDSAAPPSEPGNTVEDQAASVINEAKPIKANRAPGQIDKSALPIGAARRIRDRDHLRYVAQQPCLICGRCPGHAHHLRFAQPRALGRKVSDEWVVPLCATHHRALHGVGDEERWWKERRIDPIGHAQILWWTTRFVQPDVTQPSTKTV
jgi:hypothetical protein